VRAYALVALTSTLPCTHSQPHSSPIMDGAFPHSADATTGVQPCSATKLPAAITCNFPNYPNNPTQVFDVCCISNETSTAVYPAQVGIGTLAAGSCSYFSGVVSSPPSDEDYAVCETTAPLICEWPQGTVTCSSLYSWSGTQGESAYVTGCCGLIVSNEGPLCGVVGDGPDGGLLCAQPLATMQPVM
jgi:hypothetical protein